MTNALYGALRVMAASQCTMNNFTFGNHRYQYYETIAGGSGAGAGFDGTSVVQTHMTNSRLTDPEVLEFRFPVRLDSYEIRAGSGGAGPLARRRRRCAARALSRADDRLDLEQRTHRAAPSAWRGVGTGRPGENRIERADGRVEVLGAIAQSEMAPDDVFVISTPGGGGYGEDPGGTSGS